jgi:hypothetical protein
MSLAEALSDINSCCPFVDRWGLTIIKIDRILYDDDRPHCGDLYFHIEPGQKFISNGYCVVLKEEEVIDWISNYHVVTKRKWAICRELLNAVLIPDVVTFVLQGYVDSIK